MEEKVIGPTDTTASLPVGGALVVRLPELGAAGYQWRVSRIDSPALVVESDRPLPPGSTAPGGEGMHEFRLRATTAATVRVEFELSRPWEAAAEQQHTLTVTVK
ncbi:MAG TPA: protease inhibitor I42 family protein [Candidatus Limnocylindrales bacterium]|nr:protease inhibitor I42 family protein [Candidatus Limnocylindrales bacterium]